MSDWPEAVRALAPKMERAELPCEDVRSLLRDGRSDGATQRMEQALARLGKPAWSRWDGWGPTWHTGGPYEHGVALMASLTGDGFLPMPRRQELATRAWKHGLGETAWVVEHQAPDKVLFGDGKITSTWTGVSNWRRLKVFVRRGEMVAVSQAFPGVFQELIGQADTAWRRCGEFVSKFWKAAATAAAFISYATGGAAGMLVADVWVDLPDPKKMRGWVADAVEPPRVWLLDIQPWGEPTDAGLFKWNEDIVGLMVER